MTALKAALLSLAMFCAIAMWGVGIYSADAAGDHMVSDGYGISAARLPLFANAAAIRSAPVCVCVVSVLR